MLSELANAIKGGTKITKIGDLQVDATISRDIIYESVLTEHPVEDGSVIADHHKNLPIEFTIDGYIVEAPLNTTYPGAMVVGAVKSYVTGGGNPLKDATDLLVQYHSSHKRLTIQTPKTNLTDMMITSLSFPEDQSLGNRLFFTIALRKVIIVKTGIAGLLALGKDASKKAKEKDGNGSDGKSKQAKPKTEEGKQSVSETSTSESSKGESILHGFVF